jgi:hypothetical protein
MYIPTIRAVALVVTDSATGQITLMKHLFAYYKIPAAPADSSLKSIISAEDSMLLPRHVEDQVWQQVDVHAARIALQTGAADDAGALESPGAALFSQSVAGSGSTISK